MGRRNPKATSQRTNGSPESNDGRQPSQAAAQGDERIFDPPASEVTVQPAAPDAFDEAGYLRLNPDVRSAIEAGQIESGYAHYLAHGRAEGRALPDGPIEPWNTLITVPSDAGYSTAAAEPRCAIDAVLISPNAGLMIVGWADDQAQPLVGVRISASGWKIVLDTTRLVRVRRMDVEKALGFSGAFCFGFFGVVQFSNGGSASGPLRIELLRESGVSTLVQASARAVDDIELRNCALGYLAEAGFFGNAAVESFVCLDHGLGTELVKLNKAITKRLTSQPYVERFGPQQRRAWRGSVVVCLYGKPEFFFLQNCLFGNRPGIADYELIFVSNSPELAEGLLREAHSASLIYGLSNTLVILPGNAGFGAANNQAISAAQSDRVLVVNPDVFPRDEDWALKHTKLLAHGRKNELRLFGVPLYYDDGSLMHGGIYFEIDTMVSLSKGRAQQHKICRTQHYGKGASSESTEFTRPRPVPAVTGAFMSVDRAWYEHLGGFTEDFIFGHYEDADLCLKSMDRGVAPWIHDIKLWHLEGKGAVRQPAHEGGSIVNRWLFTRTWMNRIEAGLSGPAAMSESVDVRAPA